MADKNQDKNQSKNRAEQAEEHDESVLNRRLRMNRICQRRKDV